MNSFFGLINRMSHINRWQIMRCQYPENLMQHSFQTAIIAQHLALICQKKFMVPVDTNKCILLALYHDMEEILLGDMPTPSKYKNERMLKAYLEIAAGAKETLLQSVPDILQDEIATCFEEYNNSSIEGLIVNAADIISAYMKVLEEINSGNNEFINVRDKELEKFEQMDDLFEKITGGRVISLFLSYYGDYITAPLDDLVSAIGRPVT